MTNSARVQSFLFEFKRWAATETQIQAVALIGSQARGTATMESDVDVIVIVSPPNVYLKYRQWAELFGDVVRDQIEDYGGCTSLRVWYSDGLEIEFGFCEASWAELPMDYGTQQVIFGGMKILFERMAILGPLLNTEKLK